MFCIWLHSFPLLSLGHFLCPVSHAGWLHLPRSEGVWPPLRLFKFFLTFISAALSTIIWGQLPNPVSLAPVSLLRFPPSLKVAVPKAHLGIALGVFKQQAFWKSNTISLTTNSKPFRRAGSLLTLQLSDSPLSLMLWPVIIIPHVVVTSPPQNYSFDPS